MGVSYAGVCRSPIHAKWLVNICDLQALRQLCTPGCGLYNPTLSTCIQSHFAQILDRLNDKDASDDTEAPEEPAEGA